MAKLLGLILFNIVVIATSVGRMSLLEQDQIFLQNEINAFMSKQYELEIQYEKQSLSQEGLNIGINGFTFSDSYVGLEYTYLQTAQRIFVMANQSTIFKIVDISVPDIIFAQENCTKFVVHSTETFSVSSCTDTSDGSVYLVVISYLSSGPFYAQSLSTSIVSATNMYITGHFLFVVDPQSIIPLHVYNITLGLGGNAGQVLVPVNATEYFLNYGYYIMN